jgi:hypothetical protein
MSIKKLFAKASLSFYKFLKLFLIILLLVIISSLFWGGETDIFKIFEENNHYIVYCLVGSVLFGIIMERINRNISIIQNSLSSIGSSSFNSEADIAGKMANQAAGSNFQDFFPAAFSVEEMNVRVYRDTEESLARRMTFDFDYTNKTNPLLEKELFRQLEKVLQTHKLMRSTNNPQIIISMDFFIGKKEQYTPPNTITSTEMKSVWNYGMIGWSSGGFNPVGFASQVPVISSHTTAGYTTTSYYSNIRINFLNHDKLVKDAKLETPPLIWVGEAESEGGNPDIRGISQAMFGALIGQFSDQSASSSKYYARRVNYGGMGLGFNLLDWRAIRYVEPSSPAAEHGIKPGDVLSRINGKRANNWSALSRGNRNNIALYRSRDPYFLYVLSSHGDQEVELVIKSKVGRLFRKNVTLMIKPHVEDRYQFWKPVTK